MIALAVAAAICAPCAIENVRVEVGDGTVLESTTVVFDEDRILSVGAPAPPGARRINGSGHTLTPGLIETRGQLGLVEVAGEPSTSDGSLSGALVPGFQAADAFNPASVWIPITREEGITSAVAVPGGGVLSGTGSWVDLTGELGVTLPPAGLHGSVGESAAAAAGGSRGGVWMALREVFADARFLRRNRAAFDRGQARELSLSPLHLDALVPVIDRTQPLVLTANRASDILAALAFAQAEQLRLVISGGAEAWLVAEPLAAAGIPVIVRPSGQGPSSFESLRSRDDLAARLHRAGVPVVISSGGWNTGLRRLRQEAGIAVAHGLPRNAALRAITHEAAAAFGMSDQVGRVAAGQRANLVLWSGDPLELDTHAETVWIDGRERPHDNRQRRLVERYRMP